MTSKKNPPEKTKNTIKGIGVTPISKSNSQEKMSAFDKTLPVNEVNYKDGSFHNTPINNSLENNNSTENSFGISNLDLGTMPTMVASDSFDAISTEHIEENFFSNLTTEHSGRYEYIDDIGKGGIGKVILVLDTHIGRKVAVKELLPFHKQNSTGSSSIPNQAELRFLNEARITGFLEHPGIVPVYELGVREDGSIYYTMRMVKGKTMASLLKDKELKDRMELLSSFIDVCNAMAYAHKHGVIHRDLKPENIMIGEFGETIVLDWGLAKMNNLEDLNRGDLANALSEIRKSIGAETLNGQPMGTPPYMPPEQAKGEVEDIDEKTDVYTLGAILYEILTGSPPHSGNNPLEILLSVLEKDIVNPLDIDTHIPPELSAIAMKALQKDKSLRYESAIELAEEVKSFIQGGLVGTYHYSKLELAKRLIVKNKNRIIIFCIVLFVALFSWWYKGYQLKRLEHKQEQLRLSKVILKVESIIKKTASPKIKGKRWFDIFSYKLLALKEPIVEKILAKELNQNKSKEVRKLAARVLGGMGSRKSVDALMNRLQKGKESDSGVIVEVINALGIIGDPRANEIVRETRWRYGQYGYIWNATELAYKMIPLSKLKTNGKLESPDKLMKYGNSLKYKGKLNEALKVFFRVLKYYPNTVKAYNSVGTILKNQGKFDRAIKYLSKAIELDPDYFAPYSNRAIVYLALDNYKHALSDINKSIALNPKYPSLRLNRASILQEMGNLDLAIEDLQTAVRLNPGNMKFRLILARIFVIQGNFDKALKNYDYIEKTDQSSIFPHIDKAKIYFLKKDYKSARASIEKANEIDPNNSDVICWKIRLNLKANEKFEVPELLKTLYKVNNKNGFAKLFDIIFFDFLQKKYSKALNSISTLLSGKMDIVFKAQHFLHYVSIMVRSGKISSYRSKALELLPQSNNLSWSQIIISYLLGKITEEHFDLVAKSPNKRFDFNYYTGLKSEIEGNFKKALQRYKLVVKSSFIEDYEFIFAQKAIISLMKIHPELKNK